MEPIIKKISMIITLQPDIEKAVEWYKNLGLRLIFHIKGKWAEFDVNGVKIGLCPTGSTELPDRHSGVVFEVADLDAVFNQLKDTVTFMNDPVQALHGIMVSIKDPGNSIIDLYQPTPEKIKEYMDKQSREGCCKGQAEQSEECCKTEGSLECDDSQESESCCKE